MKCLFCKKNDIKGTAKKYCSYECKIKSQFKLIDLKCEVCGKITKIKRSRITATTCSKDCKYKRHAIMFTGKRNHLWRGGITDKNMKVRNSKEYSKWRDEVFKRDDYRCVLCGAKSCKGVFIKLNADHIKSFAHHPELRLDISNGRTLCIDCHRKTDNYGRRNRFKPD